jgi:hypothetical protein
MKASSLVLSLGFILYHNVAPSDGFLLRNHDRACLQDRRKQAVCSPLSVTPSDKCGVPGKMHSLIRPSTIGTSLRLTVAPLLACPSKIVTFVEKLGTVLHWKGFTFFFLMGWLLEPALEKTYNSVQERIKGGGWSDNEINNNEIELAFQPYQDSLFGGVVDHIAQGCRIAFSVYLVDTFRIAMQALEITCIPHLDRLPRSYMRLAYTFWVVDRIAALKRYFVAHKTNTDPEKLPRKLQVVNRAVDILVYSVGFFVPLASIRADMGTAAKGLLPWVALVL